MLDSEISVFLQLPPLIRPVHILFYRDLIAKIFYLVASLSHVASLWVYRLHHHDFVLVRRDSSLTLPRRLDTVTQMKEKTVKAKGRRARWLGREVWLSGFGSFLLTKTQIRRRSCYCARKSRTLQLSRNHYDSRNVIAHSMWLVHRHLYYVFQSSSL